jgi:chromosome segregation ATPase
MVKEFSPIGIDAVRGAVMQLQETVEGHTATIGRLQSSTENLIRQVGQVDIQVGQLAEKLSEEVDHRRKGEDRLNEALSREADSRRDGDKDVGELKGKVSSIKWTIGLSIAGVGVLLALVQIGLHFYG